MKKRPPIARMRNIGVIAHIDAGKTTVTERILYYTGRSHKMGEVHDGEAIMDWMPDEQERGITITSAVTTCLWKDCEVHIIDTPGHVDFTMEVERSLRVLDGAIGVFCAVGGVQPQSETVWHQADKYRVPKIAFINKMDRVGADFYGAMGQMVEKLRTRPLALQIPMGEAEEFSGIIDLVSMTSTTWQDETLGATYDTTPIPDHLLQRAEKGRERLIEDLAELDDEVMEAYLADKPLSEQDLLSAVRRVTIDLKAVPVLCGAALRNKGIQPLLDAIVAFLPSPLDVGAVSGVHPETGEKVECRPVAKDPLAALIFKVSMVEGRKLCFARIYSGTMHTGEDVYNPSRNAREKLARILSVHANRRDRLSEAGAGDIVGIAGLKLAATGDTLCSAQRPVLLERIETYEPVISVALEPKTHADQERIGLVLEKLTAEDPTFRVRVDEETGQTIISGMGELHLEVLVSRMQREFQTGVNVGKPQVVYRETIDREVEGEAVFDREVAGQHHFAQVRLRLAPLGRGQGNSFTAVTPPEGMPESLIPFIRQGVMEALESGPVLGYPVLDVKVALIGGTFRDSLGTELAFRVAAAMACKEGLTGGAPFLLAPIMEVEVLVPETFMGEVIGDLNARGGKIEGIRPQKGIQVIEAIVPLSRMFGYSTALRSATQGRGTFSMQFARYDRS